MGNRTPLLVASFVLFLIASARGATPEAAAGRLIERILPGRSKAFVLQHIPPQDGRDVFELESRNGQIVVRGSNGVAIASGVNWYLNHVARCQVSLCGDQLALADPPPPVPDKVRRASPYKYRYCFNYCAFSYTMPFWDWAQWERMIDWMALHGINMPLAVTGQEAVWTKVYRDLGLPEEKIRQFFVGPAYLPFGWMGCIDGWGGPLSDAWMQSHLELQKKIVARQRELGMTPVLQGFTGHVPESIKDAFPQAKLQRLTSWCGFPGTHFLDPGDPLFRRIGKAYVEEQARQFGTDHLYAADTFIEMTPPSKEPQFLDAMGKAIHGAMAAGDPQAVWVMQGWIFFNNAKFWQPPQNRAILSATPDDRMILLDLFCESTPTWTITEGFYGKPWVFSIIQSFGDQVSLHGGLPQIAANLKAARSSPKRGKLCGLGLIMEGFGHNPVVFDFLTDMAWHEDPPELDAWLMDYVRARYGRSLPEAEEAWRLLLKTAYNTPGQQGSALCARPALGLKFATAYDAKVLERACEKLLACGDQLAQDTYRYDVVHVTRQVLANRAAARYADVIRAYEKKDTAALTTAGRRYVDLLRDVDQLLATRREFLLGRWLEDARRWASDDAGRRLCQWNARNLITLWGPENSELHEYSQREWSGMIRGFYLPRWEMFLARLEQSLADGKPLDTPKLQRDLRAWEVAWTHGQEVYAAEPAGDAVATARSVWKKYFGPEK